jgi:hypothetical protein
VTATDCVFTDSRCFGDSEDILRFPVPLPPFCPQHPAYPDTGVLMRKRLWEQVGGYTEDRSLGGVEWWDFWLTASEQGMRARHIARPLYWYRTHPAGASVTSSRYNDHRNRRQIYRRHRHVFDTFHGECPHVPHGSIRAFLAQGYVVSAQASRAQGKPWRALGLLVRAFLLSPRPRSMGRELVRILADVVPGARAFKALVRR